MHIKAIFITFICAFVFMGASAQNETSELPNGAVQSYKYKVTVNGEESFVHMGCGVHFTQFSFSDSAKVCVEVLRGGFAGLRIRPSSKQLKYSRDGKKITFWIYKSYTQLSLEFEHRFADPLFIFANAPEKVEDIPRTESDTIFYFGPGIHEPGVIDLSETKKTVYLAQGAYVKGCIRAENLKGVKIFGRGVLSGEIYDNRPLDEEWHNMVSFKGCDDVELEGIILHDAQSWNILVLSSKNVNIENIKVVATTGNSDGVDVCGSKNVKIDHCFFYNNDDCIAFNNLLCSFNYKWKHGEMRPNTSNVQVLNTVLWNQPWGEPIRLGWNTMCDYQSNMLFKNIDIIYSESGAIDMNHGDRGSFRNIVFENINIEDVSYVLTLRMDGNRTCIDPVRGISETNGIHFKNIRTTGRIHNPKNIIHGFSKVNSINNISFSNFNFNGKKVKSLADLNCDTVFTYGLVFSDDATKPTAPEIKTIDVIGAHEVQLNWQASLDSESKIIYYNIYRDDEFLGISKTTTYVDYSCSPSTKYVYKMSALNAVGLESDFSSFKEIETQQTGKQWVLNESVAKQTHGYNNFYYLTYNTKPMKFYRMPESGYELASARYTYSDLRFWDMYHDGTNTWHSISNTRDTENRIDATLNEDCILVPQKGMDVVVAWKAPSAGLYEFQVKAEIRGDKEKGINLSMTLNTNNNLIAKTISFKKANSENRRKRIHLEKDDFLYFIANLEAEAEDGSLKIFLAIEDVNE